jgi:4-diphosphocytidyl-2-C-methyl-D-erythritol kinase
MSAEELTAFAPAKINLTLRVGPPRADGYHPLQSLVVFADWGDTLSAAPAAELSLAVEGPQAASLADDPHNLVLKAAWALRAAAGEPQLGARLSLEKHLPVASGLGGGSADAAAALRLLNNLWDLRFSLKELAEIGTVVGADVPACVWSRPLVMEGIGERIRLLPAWPALDAVIINPGTALATPDVFRTLGGDGARDDIDPLPRLPVAGDQAAAFALASAGGNDLEDAARALQPAVAQVLGMLDAREDTRLARMSGSGASCFALFDTSDAAREAAHAIALSHPGWLVQPVQLGGAA